MKLNWLPLLGIAVFFVLYLYAATLYPGGNQLDARAPGFDWVNNYWCDLLGKIADNGQPNPARPVAMLATGVLGLSLAMIWVRLAAVLEASERWRRLVRSSGAISMASVAVLFTEWHDTAILVSGLSGLLAVGATFWVLFQKKQRAVLRFGVGCMVLVAVNNLIYWPKIGLVFLPVVQKITFAGFLFWMGWAHLSLFLKK